MSETTSAPDPRAIITPDAFTVAPELLGLPLAHPWRRASAMLVDLALVAILANARAVFFAFAVGLFVFRLATRRRGSTTEPSTARRAVRAGFGCLGAFTLVIASLAIWFSLTADPDTEVGRVTVDDGRNIPVTVGAVRDLVTAMSGGDSVEAAAAADRLVARLEREDVERAELRGILDDLGEELDPATRARVDRAIARSGPAAPVDADTLSVDSLLARYAVARSAADTINMERYGVPLGDSLATASLAERDARIERLERRRDSLSGELDQTEATLEQERQRGILATVFALLDDVGLGLGWSGLYFTFFIAWWRGLTPGKRLLGIRVVRLDGRPISYWLAFERFGGYAASLFTGLEGFARMIWDRNRQALEDKLAETVVILDTAESRRRVATLRARSTAGGSNARRPLASRLGLRTAGE